MLSFLDVGGCESALPYQVLLTLVNKMLIELRIIREASYDSEKTDSK